MKRIGTGLLFASLWGSASVATKIGLHSAQPLILSNTRFFMAAILMLLFAQLIKKERLPQRHEWLPLIIYGALNVTIYLGAFVFAMQRVTAGIGTLAVATCALIISVLNAVWLRQKIAWNIWTGLGIGLFGVAIATYPLLLNASATPLGLLLLGVGMLSYSVGTVYYQSITWTLPRLSINAWQVFFGGLLLLPFTLFLFDESQNTYDSNFWWMVLWLAIPVSIGAVQLWLYLLKVEPTRASLWLFFCPIFGFLYAAIFTHEPITIYTVVGTAFVIVGLYLGKKEN
jgi:probable blue pigment (indigoidine) exporter